MCSMIGRFVTGSMGFGWLEVRGRRRVPWPPAKMTAFKLGSSRGVRASLPGLFLGEGCSLSGEERADVLRIAVGSHVVQDSPDPERDQPDRAQDAAERQRREREQEAEGGGLADAPHLRRAETTTRQQQKDDRE